MTNGVKELDMTKEFKSVKEQFKAMIQYRKMAIHDGDNHSYVCTSDFVRILG